MAILKTRTRKPEQQLKAAEEEYETETEAEEAQEPKECNLTPAEKRKLFQAYTDAVNNIASVEEALVVARDDLYSAVAEIKDQIGEGPFLWKGQQLKVRAVRGGKLVMRTESATAEEI